MSTTRWWWIRHAPVTNQRGQIYGQRDVDCDTGDERLFRALAGALPRGAVWLTSQLKRTHQTAEALAAAGADMPVSIVEPDLIEQNLGDWQGRPSEEVFGANAEWHRFWIAPAEIAPPGGESFADLTTRVAEAIRRRTEGHAGRDIVAVAHGGTIRAAIAHALGLAPHAALAFSIENLSLTRLDHIRGGAGDAWRIGAINRTVL